MKKEKVISNKKKMLITSILSFNVLVCVAGLTMAWFVDNLTMSVGSEASINKSYFEGGNGTSTNPYLIKYPRQYYFFTWLQDMGYFNEEDTDHPGTYKQTYFKLHNDVTTLDMSGYYLPPAGTDQYPFIGNFDGNGKTITNLNITNNPAQYTNPPVNPNNDDRNYQIMGTFGVVGSYGTMPYTFNSSAIQVKNLALNNVTVNSATPKDGKTLVGVAAGYVNDATGTTLTNIEVSGNSSITSAATTYVSSSYTTRLSDYTLVGYINRTVPKYVENIGIKNPNPSSKTSESGAIIDQYQGAGGDLVIGPADFKTVASGDEEKVERTMPDTAFYVGDTRVMQAGGPNPNSIINGAGGSFSANTPMKVKIQEAFNYYKNNGKNFLTSTGKPPENTTAATGRPNNGIWFKPQCPGTASLAFAKTNNGGDQHSMGLFVYRRTTSGYIFVKKVQFVLSKSLKNGSVVYYEYVISENEFNLDYEYVVGAYDTNAINGNAGFVAIALAGTDVDNGVIDGANASEYAIYEQTNIAAISFAGLSGVSFAGDDAATYQLNTFNQAYTFATNEHSAVTYTPNTSAVSKPTPTQTSAMDIKTITGYGANGAITVIIRKIVSGTTTQYLYKTNPAAEFTVSSEGDVGRYFIATSPFPTGDDILAFHHNISSLTSTIIPTSTFGINIANNAISITAFTVSTTATAQSVVIDTVVSPSYTLKLMAGTTQIYP